ncbi:TniQ family protein [Streptomyces sp. NBC_00237]|uniref:TniQ family protein n=1 Tax=Streptomyces sp. NBC_00237 TaxID=2975687 RepID=UPI0022592E5F|nr:TniQ family protein [Streptomyces sp. NBC_00237]MCX5205193.1 TniQ family protein [Streptomyces sp. NBC_00237]
MTQWTDGRIPLWVPPVEGEALDSWIEAYARRLRTEFPQFVRFLGLPGARGNLMVRCLTEHERQVLSKRTGLSPDSLTAMTLEPWDGLAVTLDRPTRRLNRPPHWRHTGNTTRYCPRCLDETAGRWQITWRLPWSFACTRHGVLLLDRCPECRQVPLVHGRRRLREVPAASCLYGTGSARAVRCGFYLPHAPTPTLPRGSSILATQEEVNSDVLQSSEHYETALQRGLELSALARSALRGIRSTLNSAPAVVREVLAECGGDLPEFPSLQGGGDAHNAAVGTAIANIAVHRERDDSDAVFAWLMTSSRSHRQRTKHPTAWLADWAPVGPKVTSRALVAVAHELSWTARLRYGTTTDSPAWPTLTEEDVQRRASKLPAMLWPAWTMRILPRLPAPLFRLSGLRRACATLLLTPGTMWTYPQAAQLLGNPRTFSNKDALNTALEKQRSDELASLIVLLARALDANPVPIDYHRRRAIFSENTITFDLNRFQEYSRRRGLRIGPVQIERLRWHLLKLLLGADPGTSSRTPTWNANLAHQITIELKDFVLQQATENLRSHGIDEPVLWQPPSSWLSEVEFPGADPDRINNVELAEMMTLGRTLTEIAAILGIGEDHVLLHLEATGISAALPSVSRSPAPGRNIPRQGPLSPPKLRQLYQEQRISPCQIAQLAGCSHTTVRRALNEAKITSRSTSGIPPIVPALVTREWLVKEYASKGRSCGDIARELGVHKDCVSKQLGRWGIPRWPKGLCSNPFAPLNVVLSPEMQRVSRTRNCLSRLRNLLQMPGHSSLTTAAAALGVPMPTLRHQLRTVERTLEFTVIARTSPLSVSPAGVTFLDEARHLISLLESGSALSGRTPASAPATYSDRQTGEMDQN